MRVTIQVHGGDRPAGMGANEHKWIFTVMYDWVDEILVHFWTRFVGKYAAKLHWIVSEHISKHYNPERLQEFMSEIFTLSSKGFLQTYFPVDWATHYVRHWADAIWDMRKLKQMPNQLLQ